VVGSDVSFASGAYAPYTASGRRLLAHELTHVVQQRALGPIVSRDLEEEARHHLVDPSLYPQLSAEIDRVGEDMSQNDDLALRANASRVHLLLSYRSHPLLTIQDELDDFVMECHVAALTEIDTLNALPQSGRELAMAAYAQGFPLEWSGRYRYALSLGVNAVELLTRWQDQLEHLRASSRRLGPGIYGHGLPVPASELARLTDFTLRIVDSRNQESPVGEYAREGVRHIQLKWVVAFAFTWERMTDNVAEAVADGEVIASYAAWRDFMDNRHEVLRTLPQRAHELLAGSDEEANAFADTGQQLANAAVALGMVSGLAGLMGILSGWGEVSELFLEGLHDADRLIAEAGRGDRFQKALIWAWENGYFGAAADAALDALIANAPRILAELATILIAQTIPVVNVALDLYLLFSLGWDVASLLGELTMAVLDVTAATSVPSLQRAAHRLSVVLMNGGLQIATVLITMGVARTTSAVRTRANAIRAAETGLSEETAMRRAFEELPRQQRAPLEEGAARQAQDAAAAHRRANDPTSFPAAERASGPIERPRPGEAMRDVTPETRVMLERRPDLRRALDRSPRASRALRKCASPCYPDFATTTQIDRLERMLEAMETSGRYYDPSRLTNYLRTMTSTAELEIALNALARDVERRLGVVGEFAETGRLGPDASTPLPSARTTVLRNTPGVAASGQGLPRRGAGWFEATATGANEVRVALIPGEIADRLRRIGRFETFDSFRQTFWQLVANDPVYRRAFAYYPENITRMRAGLAPWPPSRRITGGRVETVGRGSNAVYQLNHRHAVEHGGGVYDLDNIEIVTPRFHGEVAQ